MDLMIKDPDRFWTPIETIDWTKQNLKPFFAPGNGFHYSDANYNLLGLIIESITQKPMHESLSKYIFDPLGMDDTYQLFYSEPKSRNKQPMVNLYYNDLNLVKTKSISLDWAGGGIVSTSEDMLKFISAIKKHQIIKKETFEEMKDWAKMGPGLYYGYGLMNFRFMLTPKKYDIWGNSGSIGAFMYYNPAIDVYMIGSFHKLNYHAPPIMFIVRTLKKLNKLQKQVKTQMGTIR
jgi:CubicO group peptidase (beta-lactamase class C family)